MVNSKDKNNNQYFRQGDIIFEKVDKIDIDSLIPLETKTVAMGEATGHHHSFNGSEQVLLFKTENKIELQDPEYLTIKASQGAVLTHQEHRPLILPKGNYRIVREVEYNPFSSQIQRVTD